MVRLFRLDSTLLTTRFEKIIKSMNEVEGFVKAICGWKGASLVFDSPGGIIEAYIPQGKQELHSICIIRFVQNDDMQS